MTHNQLEAAKFFAEAHGATLSECDVEFGHEWIDADGNYRSSGPRNHPVGWIVLTVHRKGTPAGGWDPIAETPIGPQHSPINMKCEACDVAAGII
tara:strand:- start:130 stop:414 length:285 start_codon:yes stop_codon:yes gene_type:complete